MCDDDCGSGGGCCCCCCGGDNMRSSDEQYSVEFCANDYLRFTSNKYHHYSMTGDWLVIINDMMIR